MDEIQHKFVEIRSLKLHIAEIGTGDKVVVFLHGFPEIWYSWRHQMIAVANAGYRAIAPDFRGYGLSEVPSEPEKTTFMDLINDLHAILDSFGIPKVFVVGKDFGGRPAYYFTLFHPERVSGVITLGVPYVPPGQSFSVQGHPPEGLYVLRWQKPGRAEADFARFDVKTVVKNIYILFSKSELPIAEENKEVMDLVEPSTPLPTWFTEEDLSVYASLYEKSGFRTPLQVPYRSLKENFSVNNVKVMAPALMIMGEKDYTLKFNGIKEYIISGKMKEYVPNLETVYVPEGSHFVQEQFPDKEQGRAEADFGRFDVKTVVKNIYILFSKSDIPIAEENKEIMDLVDPSTPLPTWFTEEDLSVYATLYEKSGFRTPLQMPYRALREPLGTTETKVMAPALLIVGEKDYGLKFQGFENYITSGKVKEYVPNLEIVFVAEGSHFVQEQFPEKVNQLIVNFLSNHI
ncbi:hypothetical protein AQUCO_07100021v1 [Aquilegia coerulea]|uniref:AB hydrolase-1 domain-containing protein n=1 Tax=Aquilegia coerulea TaxID=218851 RepID=A0A2G5CAQ6_AQUCA|nr:hypothetical protein AQUCO_07100021v1 [Aquilegia coerulea]